MAGLLDFNDPETRMGLGLLALSQMPRSQTAQGLMGLLASQDQAAKDKADAEWTQLQTAKKRQEMDAAAKTEQANADRLAAIPSLYEQGAGGGLAGFNVQRAIALGMDPDTIQKYAALPNVGRQEVARTIETTDGQGRPITVQLDKFGNRIGEGLGAWKAPMVINQGDRQTLLDPATRQTLGSLGVNMSQAERDASARGWASNAIARERLSMDRADMGPGGVKAPAGYRWGPDGNLVAIPGGPAEKSNTATEGERKAATLLQRLEGSQSQYLNALADDKDAAKPGLIANGLRSMGAEALANTVTGENRQRVEAAQLDMLDAALTLGTGAAYTREQLEGYRKSYFPQLGDDPKTIAEKQARLDNVISSARVAAGRAAKSIPSQTGGASGSWDGGAFPKVPMRGQVIGGYKFKGGNPADQSNWEKQ